MITVGRDTKYQHSYSIQTRTFPFNSFINLQVKDPALQWSDGGRCSWQETLRRLDQETDRWPLGSFVMLPWDLHREKGKVH